jgi:hypothetical protein
VPPRALDYTPQLAAKICARIAAGDPIRTIAASARMPRSSTIYQWLTTREDFRLLYAAACEELADVLADQMLSIADDSSGDFSPPAKGAMARAPDREALARAKLRIETRRWRAARLAPHRYGDRVETVHAGGPAPLSHEDALAELE